MGERRVVLDVLEVTIEGPLDLTAREARAVVAEVRSWIEAALHEAGPVFPGVRVTVG
jgi:hypothetical protein